MGSADTAELGRLYNRKTRIRKTQLPIFSNFFRIFLTRNYRDFTLVFSIDSPCIITGTIGIHFREMVSGETAAHFFDQV